MSQRNIRKLYGNTPLLPPEDNSDEEYEPLYAKRSPSKYTYQGLVLSSHSESEHESTDAVDIEDTSPVEIYKKKKNNKKKKQRKSKSMPRSSSKETIEMDEIDKSIMEVNAMLGSPVAPAASTSTDNTETDPGAEILTINHKHLNVANELNKLFGPEPVEPGNRRRGRQPNLIRLFKKDVIVPIPENAPKFKKIGLSMSEQRRENGYRYFTFDHNKDYQNKHRTFLRLSRYRTNDAIMHMDVDHTNLHIEEMLEAADSMFRIEEYTVANTLVEQVIAYMQYVAHPLFNLTLRKTRLEYKFVENRPFHIALLKYLHLLTNRACHRTALELAKLLLQLDPSDPLAVLFIIDTLALRAREHQWLIDAVDYWCNERHAKFMFNLQYSYAMAHFHVATKSKGSVSEADKLLQIAILRFPTIVLKILDYASQPLGERLQSHPLFVQAEEMTRTKLKDVIMLYCKFTWPKWREPAVLEWLTRNVNEVVEVYDKDPILQERARELSTERMTLFRGWPDEIVRHLTVIKPMSSLLVDGAVPRMFWGSSYNPMPPLYGVNRYGYQLDGTTNAVAGNSPLFELFSSILPDYDIGTPVQQHEGGNIQQEWRARAMAAFQDDLNNEEIEVDAEYQAADDTLTDDEDAATGTDPAAGSGEPGQLPNAVRRIMDFYETDHDPEDEPDDPLQG